MRSARADAFCKMAAMLRNRCCNSQHFAGNYRSPTSIHTVCAALSIGPLTGLILHPAQVLYDGTNREAVALLSGVNHVTLQFLAPPFASAKDVEEFAAWEARHWQWGGKPGNFRLMVKQGKSLARSWLHKFASACSMRDKFCCKQIRSIACARSVWQNQWKTRS